MDQDLLSMTKIQLDDVLESYRTRLYDMEIHQRKSKLNYQKLKTMVKRNIDQRLRSRNFDARHWKIETGAVQESHGINWRRRRKRYLLPVERKRPVFARRQVQFPA